jgi:acyl-CoA thioester hydrolase
MARIKIGMPDKYIFSTEIPVQISDINYAGHLGNDSVLSMVHEARVRFLNSFNYTELDVEGDGIIMTDSAIVYKAEAFHADIIRIDVSVGDFNKYGCDIFYLLSNNKTNVEIAHAKTGIVFFNYNSRKVVSVPENFKSCIDKDLKEAQQ